MPYYLRFLKSPMLEYNPQNQRSAVKSRGSKIIGQNNKSSGLKLQLTFTCQTDLGDTYYDGDALVVVHLTAAAFSDTSIAHGIVRWKKGDRVLSDLVQLHWNQEFSLPDDPWILLEATPGQDSVDQQHSKSLSTTSMTNNVQFHLPSNGANPLSAKHMPEIISVAAPIALKNRKASSGATHDLQRHVLRHFITSKPIQHGKEPTEYSRSDQHTRISIYEELGESIARQIWDAALALIAAFTENPASDVIKNDSAECHRLPQLLLPYFHKSVRNKEDDLTILELGSGCGIVGLSLACLVPDAQFILTDLPEAMETLDMNVSYMIESGLASGTSVTTKVLDWEWALRDDTQAANDIILPNVTSMSPDLVIVSDCTYNSGSFKALVATLLRVVGQNRRCNHRQEQLKLDILLSYKYRHESERQFFEDMQRAGFHILDHRLITFPDSARASVGVDYEKAEIFAFALQDSVRE